MPYTGKQEVRRRLLNDTDFGDNTISPHIIFDLEDRPEEFIGSLKTLSRVGQKLHYVKKKKKIMQEYYNVISPSYVAMEKYTHELLLIHVHHDFLLQNNVNINNIKVCPSDRDRSQRTVYVECDHNLETEVKEKLENETAQLGSPGTLKVFTQPEPMIIKKDEGL